MKFDSKLVENIVRKGNGRKHCGKRRKYWSPAFSPFPTMFSKVFFLRAVKSPDCVIKMYQYVMES